MDLRERKLWEEPGVRGVVGITFSETFSLLWKSFDWFQGRSLYCVIDTGNYGRFLTI